MELIQKRKWQGIRIHVGNTAKDTEAASSLARTERSARGTTRATEGGRRKQ